VGRIHLLDPKTISQIAAGEVIERPASVVKELVENAIDAGARRIRIELEDGGRTLIRVTDDGCGMTPDDAELAFVRHATSKIRSLDDLVESRTLGFRGEALPSVASVAVVELLTREAQAPAATLVRWEGGRPAGVEVAAGPPGTQVTVRRLFYNLPARLKFLKTDRTESEAAVEVVGRAAIAHPEIAFVIEVGGRVSLRTEGRGDLLAVVLNVWGRDLAGALEPLAREDGALRLRGFIGRPEANWSNRGRQPFFVNGRPVQSPLLSRAFEDAYKGLLPTGRRPVGILFLDVPGEAVDVNVHPAKTEVRLAREKEVYSFVRAVTAERLQGSAMIRKVVFDTAQAFSAGMLREDNAAMAEWFTGGKGRGAVDAGPSASPGAGTATLEWPELRPLGQLHQLYLVAEGPDGLYLIDQHAAHERIIFDRLGETGPGPVQELLVPVPVELSAAEGETFEDHREALQALGFVVEPFGDRSLLVRAVPAVFGGECGPQDIRDVLDALNGEAGETAADGDGEGEGATDLNRVRRVVAACRAAIKARNPLFRSEMEALLRDLAATAHPLTCPHGRPTIIRMSLDELHRRFGRSGGGPKP